MLFSVDGSLKISARCSAVNREPRQALTPTIFRNIVGDDFPVLHPSGCCLLIVQNRLRCGFGQFKLCGHSWICYACSFPVPGRGD